MDQSCFPIVPLFGHKALQAIGPFWSEGTVDGVPHFLPLGIWKAGSAAAGEWLMHAVPRAWGRLFICHTDFGCVRPPAPPFAHGVLFGSPMALNICAGSVSPVPSIPPSGMPHGAMTVEWEWSGRGGGGDGWRGGAAI